MRCLWRISLLALVALCVVSCDDNDDYAPAYEFAFCDVITDGSGHAQALLLDSGERLTATGKTSVSVKDMIFRGVSIFVREEAAARVVQIAQIPSSPYLELGTTTIKQDPLRPLAVWRGSHYLNFQLELPTGPSAKGHIYGLFLTELEDRADGGQTAHFVFHHDQNGDDAYYYRDAYFSADLSQLSTDHPLADSLSLSIMTPRGLTTFAFPCH